MKEYKDEFDLCPFCGYINDTPAKSKNHLEPGTEIANRYIIGKSLGQGGFGITYIAWDNKIQKTVTIKEFFPNALSTRGSGEVSVSCFNDRAEAHFKEGMKKMLDEGRRLSKFTDNENIVDVYDFFEENNTSYIVMEYLSGKDLKQFLEEKGGKLDPEEAVKIILPILNALSDMHKAQLIHRDVAPDNIFLCDNGKIKLLDFGSARLAVDENEKSLSIMLKHGFAPKEQYSSRSNQGPWTDVYAVCATLYKMITGEVPPDSIDRKSDSLKPLSAFGVTGFAALEEVISKGLEVESEDRYQDVKTLAEKLKKAVNTSEIFEVYTASTPKQKKKISVIIIFILIAILTTTFFVLKSKKGENIDINPSTGTTTEQTTENNILTSAIELTNLTLGQLSTTFHVADVYSTQTTTQNSSEEITSSADKITVPDFTKQSFIVILSNPVFDKNFDFEPVYEYRNDIETGYIYEQSPPPDTLVAPGTKIVVFVSRDQTSTSSSTSYAASTRTSTTSATTKKLSSKIVISGKCGTDLAYSLHEDGELAFHGSGKMMDWALADYPPWYINNHDNIKKISIPNGVTRIGNYAFLYCGNLLNCTIPNTVNTIGKNAFWECVKLKEIIFEENSQLTTIENQAFSDCKKLTTFTIPHGVTYIGKMAFAYCYDLKNIYIPNSVTEIGENWIFLCNDLTDIYYSGSKDEWNKITFGSQSTPELSEINIHYNSW